MSSLHLSFSPKHCEYSSLLTGQIPVSLACLCWRLVSSFSCRLMTSSLVAGVLDTLCTHSCPPSLHSRGGRMELRISSVSLLFWASTGGSLLLAGGLGIGPAGPLAAGTAPPRGVCTWNTIKTNARGGNLCMCMILNIILINSSNMQHTLDLLSVFLLMSTGLSYLTSEEVVGIILTISLAHDFDHASCYGDWKTLISAHLTPIAWWPFT